MAVKDFNKGVGKRQVQLYFGEKAREEYAFSPEFYRVV
jgi:hypothetical protein